MNKTAIKNFAVRARNKLIEQVKQKAYEIGIDEENTVQPQVEGEDSAKIYNRYLSKQEMKQRDRLIREIDSKGYEQVMEEVAYTWFNRFVALRFMEVNGYLPTGVRVLSSQEEGKIEPDIINEALNIDLNIDAETVYQYQDKNNREELYKYLLVKQCNSLNEIMPFIFEKIADYTEILLPDNLLSEGSVIRDMVGSIEEKDWQEVEVIGWLYQFYISEKKDEVFGSKSKIKKEEIPAATQLFTPDWIVKYMVENSLGRYWLETYPNEKLQEKWDYYLEEPEQEPEVKKQLEEIRDRDLNPEEITVLDPACGSGHIIVYAFDVLYEIYKSAGFMESDIPQLILNNNLYGLEICDRAGQLASLSVMMKAREKDSRIFKKEINLNICSIQETNRISTEVIELLVENMEDDEKKNIIEKDLEYLLDVYEDAKMYGSIIDLKKMNSGLLNEQIVKFKSKKVDNLFDIPNKEVVLDLLPRIIKQAEIMSKKYDIVVTNPPYMGRGNMNSAITNLIDSLFPNSKYDLYAVFIKKCRLFLKTQKSFCSIITMHSWMFLKSYRYFRNDMIKQQLVNMVHLGDKAFEEIGGQVVKTTAFVFRDLSILDYKPKYVRLVDYKNSKTKKEQFFNSRNYYTEQSLKSISILPMKQFVYRMTDRLTKNYNHKLLEKKLDYNGAQNKTANNKKYLRYIWEVSKSKLNSKWYKIAKGGEMRKWYGNIEYVIDFSDEAKTYYNENKTSCIMDERYLFREGVTWTKSAFGNIPSFRLIDEDCLYETAAPTIHVNDNILFYYILGFLNSIVAKTYIMYRNESNSYQVVDIITIPFIRVNKYDNSIYNFVNNSVKISRNDWNSFETSWNFKEHPLLTHKNDAKTIEEAFNNWSEFAEDQFYQLKENEEELNRIFIDIYGLEDELTPKVPEKDVTVHKADRGRDITSFMSYAVGCMLGRYSLDEEGLVYAGGEFDKPRYKNFEVDEDGIIPVLDDEYFDDDIVAKFVEFVKVTFGEEHLEENLEYIADALIESGTSGQKTPRETIRRYFLFDFIKDHVSTYNKRPIYWLFQSDGRGKAFNALIYMHRYNKNTVARVRTDYLHELQKKIEAEKVRLQGIIDSDLSTREKNKAKKKLKKLEKNTKELREYDEKLNHLANQQIEIDLDDGVDENYKKFDEVLKNI